MIDVVGGCYLEHCREPSWSFLFGSGLRAALQLRLMRSRVRLHTLIAGAQRDLLRHVAEPAGITLDAQPIPETIHFDYDHGLSVPVITPDPRTRDYPHDLPVLSVKANKVLCFGLIEGRSKITATEVVYDPQSPTTPLSFRKSGGVADRLAVVANRSELGRLTGTSDLRNACRRLLNSEDAEVVIAKMGPAGCLVATRKKMTTVPAFRTDGVFPIGSGDVFSAAFAKSWLEDGEPPENAAHFASRAAALYCGSKAFASAAAIAKAPLVALEYLAPRQHKQVYLAGPFFNAGQRWLIEQARSSLLDCGIKVFSPLHDVGRGVAAEVYGPDIEGLKTSSVMLACLDGLDPGTLYEIGYAHALGLQVVVLVGAEREEDLKMIQGGGSLIVDDFTTAVYLAAWAATCK